MEENLIYKIEILKAIERYYSIEIKDEEIESIVSFEDLIEMVKNKDNLKHEKRNDKKRNSRSSQDSKNN